MMPDINDIRKRRLRLGLNQKDLARASQVSQSLIAKIESGKMNPSYKLASSIFHALEYLEKKEEKKAKDIMNKDIAYGNKKDLVGKAVKIMRKNDFSQLPVFDGKDIVGSITEKTIMDQISEGRDISKLRIESIMEEPFPRISDDVPLRSFIPLLEHSQAILVTKKDKIVGIITKADLLKVVGS